MTEQEEFVEESVDFLAYIKADLEALKKSRDAALKAVNDALSFLNSNDIFDKDAEFNLHLANVHQTLDVYVKQQMEMEKREQSVVRQVQPQQQAQKSWWQKISQFFTHRNEPPQTTTPYRSTDLQEKIAWVRKQFERHHALLEYQDIANRRQKLLMHWRLYISQLFGEIANYVQASYAIEEEQLRALREALTRAWVGSETTPYVGENKK